MSDQDKKEVAKTEVAKTENRKPEREPLTKWEKRALYAGGAVLAGGAGYGLYTFGKKVGSNQTLTAMGKNPKAIGAK